MNKGIISIENNMNIEVSYCKYNNETYIEIIPYDRELNIVLYCSVYLFHNLLPSKIKQLFVSLNPSIQ